MVIGTGLSDHMCRQLREAVLEHRETERRRAFSPVLRMGSPGRSVSWHVDRDDPGDLACCTDLAGGLLLRCRALGQPHLAWLTRPGDLEVRDLDITWCGAVRSAYAEAGVRGLAVVVTRHGWVDPLTGEGRTWVRLRRSSTAEPPRHR